MNPTFTPPAREVMNLAEQEARELNHDFVGTEHILLGLLRESSGTVLSILKTFNLDANRVRSEVQQLATPGMRAITLGRIPLTPRAKRAIFLASSFMDDQVGPEHLLMGLMREGEGVAALALRKLGLEGEPLVREALKIRLRQLKLVEKVVRPLPASQARKRQIREELLAHLTTIYQQELAARNDPAAAMNECEKRIGDTDELTREFERTLPRLERLHFQWEKLIGWRPPETGTRWMFRLAIFMFVIVLPESLIFALTELARIGWSSAVLSALRPIIAIQLVFPLGLFILGTLYFKIRDSIFGVFGSRRSNAALAGWGTLFAVTVFLLGTSTIALLQDSAAAMNLLNNTVAESIILAIGYCIYARIFGPREIQDTIWAIIEIDG